MRLKEQLKLLMLSQEDKSPLVNNSIVMDGLHGDGMDNISDLISSQEEINKLSTQLAKTTAECQYWRELANRNEVSCNTQLLDMMYDNIQVRGPDNMESISVQLEVRVVR